MVRIRAGCLALLLVSVAAGAQGSVERIFDIDAGGTDVHWRVYKAGAFARFGHNHVIAARELEGSVRLAASPGDSEWELTIPYAGLVVDDPALRSLYGEDFSSEPSADDIASTRTNMLTDKVLNGEQYSQIVIRGAGLEGSLENARLPVVVELLGRSIALTLPARIEIDDHSLTASGEFSLEHADLGMEPFSVMLGALQVGSTLDFTYRIHAVERAR